MLVDTGRPEATERAARADDPTKAYPEVNGRRAVTITREVFMLELCREARSEEKNVIVSIIMLHVALSFPVSCHRMWCSYVSDVDTFDILKLSLYFYLSHLCYHQI